MQHFEENIIRSTHFSCDLCGKLFNKEKRCSGCDKHICNKCSAWWKRNPWTGQYDGDFCESVCQKCYEKSQPFVEQAENIREESGGRIEQLIKEWQILCKS